jgi:hypothetical protein
VFEKLPPICCFTPPPSSAPKNKERFARLCFSSRSTSSRQGEGAMPDFRQDDKTHLFAHAVACHSTAPEPRQPCLDGLELDATCRPATIKKSRREISHVRASGVVGSASNVNHESRHWRAHLGAVGGRALVQRISTREDYLATNLRWVNA